MDCKEDQVVDLKRPIELSVMLAAALLEVGGDAIIRRGLRGRGLLLVVSGVLVLGAYGLLINLLELDFSKLLGAYVGFFAMTSVLFGRLVFGERIPRTTWTGLAIVLVGS